MAKKQSILGFYEILGDGKKVHRWTSELLSGKYHPDWIHNLPGLGIHLRGCLMRNELTYECDSCRGKLYLAGNIYGEGEEKPQRAQRLHLRHCSGSEQRAECDYAREEHKSKEEIDKDRYSNKKESPQHLKLKEFLKTAIENEFPECEVQVEKWRADGGTRRRPDLNLHFIEDGLLPKGQEMSIEIQVSPIFRVDVERRMEIDKDAKRFTMWIMESFSPDDDLYKQDIYDEGGLNAFVLDEEVILKTEETGKLHLKVCYDKYNEREGEVAPVERVWEIITFPDLKFNYNDYSVYRYPSKSNRDECLNKAEEFRKRREEEREEEFRIWKEVDNLCDAIIYNEPWDGSIESIVAILKKSEEYYNEFLNAIKNGVEKFNLGWNLLADIIHISCDLKKADSDNEIDSRIDLDFDSLSKLVSRMLWSICSRERVDDPHQFCMGKVMDLFPEYADQVLSIVTNPNYRIQKYDIERATDFINKYRNKPDEEVESQGLDAASGDLYCYWAAFLFANRIVNKNPQNKEEMLKLMKDKWEVLCVFLSLEVGFIVRFRYKDWNRFPDYMMKNHPEFVRKFLEVAQRKGYKLKSKKKDWHYVLSQFLETEKPQTPPEYDMLLHTVFKNL